MGVKGKIKKRAIIVVILAVLAIVTIFPDMVPDRQFIQGTAGDSSISNSSPEVVESGLSEECS